MDTSLITVESGDTLSALAVQHGTTVDALVQANNIADPDLILVGQNLLIPPELPLQTTVQSDSVSTENTISLESGDTLSEVAQDYGTTVDSLAQANGISDPDLVVVGQEIFIPVEASDISSDNQTHPEPSEELPSAPSPSPEWLEANIDASESGSTLEDSSANPGTSPELFESNDAPEIPEVNPPEQRFNDITGDQSDIHGFDVSGTPEADVTFGYLGEDGEGAWSAGAGVLDWENSDTGGPLTGFEFLTAEGKGNIIGTFEQDDFWGAEFDAQVIEAETEFYGQSLNLGYLNANGNYGGDPDGFGLMFNANYADIQYSNGAPSATNSNDIGIDFGLSALMAKAQSRRSNALVWMLKRLVLFLVNLCMSQCLQA